MKLIVLSNPENLADEHQVITSLFKSGLRNFHIYKPQFTIEDTRKFISDIPSRYHKYLVLHHHFELLGDFRIKGIHFRRSRNTNTVKQNLNLAYYKLLHPTLQTSTTFHHISNLSFTNPLYTHIWLSPVFKSPSRRRVTRAFDWTELENTLGSSSLKVMAAGGISFPRMEEIRNFGFKGAVLRNVIWKNEDPVAEFNKFRAVARRPQYI